MPLVEFDRKVSLLALTSFVLSLIAITHQFIGYMRGAIIDPYPPSLLTLTRFNFGTTNKPQYFLNIEGPITYTNRGELGYNDVVSSERISFLGPSDRKIEMEAYNFFESFDAPPEDPDGPLKYVGLKAAGPKVVPARDATTRGVRFVSYTIDCRVRKSQGCVADSNFVSFDKTFFDFLASTPEIEFTFSANLLVTHKQLVSSCYIRTEENDLVALQRRGWATFVCHVR